MTKVSIIGAGNFGFALAYHLDRQASSNFTLSLYDHDIKKVDYISQHRVHPHFFPTIILSPATHLTSSLPELLSSTDVLILAMVSTALETVLAQIKPLINQPLIVISVMKALDDDTGLPLTTIIEQNLAGLPVSTGVLAGGTTGEALTQEQYLGATLAIKDADQAQLLQSIFASPYLQVECSTDLLGVQYASSFKNLISILVGIMAGLGFAYGTQTHILSLVAAECQRLAVQLGAQPETFAFASQCWGNDMVMSATSPTRNYQFGTLLGQGFGFDEALAQLARQGKTIESVNTLTTLEKIVDLSDFCFLSWLVLLSHQKVPAHSLVKVLETASLKV